RGVEPCVLVRNAGDCRVDRNLDRRVLDVRPVRRGAPPGASRAPPDPPAAAVGVSDALTWYVVVQAMAVAVWPLVARALAPLNDRGWGAAKTAGLLGIAWLVWLVCMLTPLPFTRATLLVATLLVGA